MRAKNAGSNAERRERYLKTERYITDLRVRLTDPPGTVYPDDGLRRAPADGGAAALARLAELEAGAPVGVDGWRVGLGGDDGYRTFTLESDGSLTPDQ
jgi:hypothetical protein